MLDLKKLKKDSKSVADNLKRRGFKLDLDTWDKLEASRKSLQSDTENLQAELNEISKEIGIHKKEGSDSSKLEKKASGITLKIKSQSKELTPVLEDLDDFISSIPNLIDDDVPEGNGEEDNVELRTSGNLRDFTFSDNQIIFFGSESNGLSKTLSSKMDHKITIQRYNDNVESLNLATSVGIILSELKSQTTGK